MYLLAAALLAVANANTNPCVDANGANVSDCTECSTNTDNMTGGLCVSGTCQEVKAPCDVVTGTVATGNKADGNCSSACAANYDEDTIVAATGLKADGTAACTPADCDDVTDGTAAGDKVAGCTITCSSGFTLVGTSCVADCAANDSAGEATSTGVTGSCTLTCKAGWTLTGADGTTGVGGACKEDCDAISGTEVTGNKTDSSCAYSCLALYTDTSCNGDTGLQVDGTTPCCVATACPAAVADSGTFATAVDPATGGTLVAGCTYTCAAGYGLLADGTGCAPECPAADANASANVGDNTTDGCLNTCNSGYTNTTSTTSSNMTFTTTTNTTSTTSLNMTPTSSSN